MKTKFTFVIAAFIAITAGSLQQATAQSWRLAGNAGTNADLQFVGTTDNVALAFRTQNLQRMRIGQGGNVLIGTGTVLTDVKLQLLGGTNAGLGAGGYMLAGAPSSQNVAIDVNGIMSRNNGVASALYLNEYGGNVYIDRNNTGSRLGIGTASPLQKLHVAGNSYISGRLGIGVSSPAVKLHVAGGSDVNENNGGYIVFGELNGSNMGIDDNEIQARTGTGAGTLFLNNSGGDINMRQGRVYIVGATGNMGIGTISPAYKLDVCGTIRAKEVRVETGWCDYVFDQNYKLRPLADLEKYIQQNKHLPNIPPATEVETNGLKLAEMSAKMMEKIEELTLYIIAQEKAIDNLKKQNITLEAKINSIDKNGGK